MATAIARIGATLTFENGKEVTVYEGDLISGLKYTSGSQTLSIDGQIRVINASTKANNTIPADCPPEPYVHRYITVASLTIDSSDVFDAEMTRIPVNSIVSIDKVNDEYATPEFDVNGESYYTLEEAIAAAKSGDVIEVSRDADINVAIPVGVTVAAMPGYELTVPPEVAPDVMSSGGTVKIVPSSALVLNGEPILGANGRMTLAAGMITVSMSDHVLTIGDSGKAMIPADKTMYYLLDYKNGTRVPLNGVIQKDSMLTINGVVKLPALSTGMTLTLVGDILVESTGYLQVASKATLGGTGVIKNAGVITLHASSANEATLNCSITLQEGGVVYSQLKNVIDGKIINGKKETGSFTVDGVVDGSGAPIVFTTKYVYTA